MQHLIIKILITHPHKQINLTVKQWSTKSPPTSKTPELNLTPLKIKFFQKYPKVYCDQKPPNSNITNFLKAFFWGGGETFWKLTPRSMFLF